MINPALDYAELNPRSPVPMAEQIRRCIRRAIAERRVKLGDSLPPVREVEKRTGVNMNTVARLYRELGEEGLLDASRGRGTRVLAHRSRNTIYRSELRDRVRDLVADAILGGLSRETVRSILDRLEVPRRGKGRRRDRPPR